MSEIDPWAMQESAAVNPGSVGLPGSIYTQAPRVKPLDHRWPRVLTVLGALYVSVGIAEIFYIDHAVSMANQLNAMIIANQFPSMSQSAQLRTDDNTVATVSWVALIVFLAILVALGAWQRSMGETFGSVGARRAVLARARYGYLRAAWLTSLVFALFLQATTTSSYVDSYVAAVGHYHLYMLLNGVRAVLGAAVVYFANRLARVADEAVGLLNGTSVPY